MTILILFKCLKKPLRLQLFQLLFSCILCSLLVPVSASAGIREDCIDKLKDKQGLFHMVETIINQDKIRQWQNKTVNWEVFPEEARSSSFCQWKESCIGKGFFLFDDSENNDETQERELIKCKIAELEYKKLSTTESQQLLRTSLTKAKLQKEENNYKPVETSKTKDSYQDNKPNSLTFSTLPKIEAYQLTTAIAQATRSGKERTLQRDESGFKENICKNHDCYAAEKIILSDGSSIPMLVILDGHGSIAEFSQLCPEYLKTHLPIAISDRLKKQEIQSPDSPGVVNALTLAFVNTNHDFYPVYREKKAEETAKYNINDDAVRHHYSLYYDSGSTANVVLIWNKTLVTANVGDSRAIFINIDNGKITQLSPDDAFYHDDEFERVYQRFGCVTFKNKPSKGIYFQTNAVINISASFGDFDQQGSLSVRPAITMVPLPESGKGILVQGSDGLFDYATTMLTGQLALQYFHEGFTPEEIACKLVVRSHNAGRGHDDITALVTFIGL